MFFWDCPPRCPITHLRHKDLPKIKKKKNQGVLKIMGAFFAEQNSPSEFLKIDFRLSVLHNLNSLHTLAMTRDDDRSSLTFSIFL